MHDDEMDLGPFLAIFWRRWQLIAAAGVTMALVGAAIALGNYSWTPPEPEYQATAVLLMEGAEWATQYPEIVWTAPVLKDVPGFTPDQLRGMVSGAKSGDYILSVKAVHTDPETAALIANRVAHNLLRYTQALRQPLETRTPMLISSAESTVLPVPEPRLWPHVATYTVLWGVLGMMLGAGAALWQSVRQPLSESAPGQHG